MEMDRDSILRHEAAFADKAYLQHAGGLEISPEWLRRYSHPVHKWDLRQFSAMWLGQLEGRKLLDYGCGMGEEAMFFARCGARVTAVDISPAGVDMVLRRAAHNGLADRVEAFQMDAAHTTFGPNTFDLVHGLGIIHHVGLEASLREIKRILKPGGRGVFLEHMMNSETLARIRGKLFAGQGEYTDFETPLRWKDCQRFSSEFTRFELFPYYLLGRLRRHVRLFRNDFTRRIDYAALRAIPPLRYFAGSVVICLEK